MAPSRSSASLLLVVLALSLAAATATACDAAAAAAASNPNPNPASNNRRRLAQIRSFGAAAGQPAVSAYASAPVSVNAAPPPVQSSTFGKKGGLFALPSVGAEAPSTVVVLPTPAPAPVIAAPTAPTTVLPAVDGGLLGGGGGISAGSLSLTTESPVEVNSPVNVSTPVRQSSSQKGGKTISAPILAGLGTGKKAHRGAGGGVTAANAIGLLGAGVGALNLFG